MMILDTCTLLWLVADQKKLSARAKRVISENSGNLFVSSVSSFEIALKAKKGKLELPIPVSDWFREAKKHHGIQEIPINSSIAIGSVELPSHHNDPCDRFIIATAVEHSMLVLTPDTLISQYDEITVIW